MKTLLILASFGMAATLSAAPVDWSKLPPAANVPGVTFDKDISPIFKESCVRCHSGQRPRAQLRLDTLDGVLKGTEKGPVLKVGDSANSLLVQAVSRLDPETAMPPKPHAPRGPHPMGTNAPSMTPHEGGPMGAPAGVMPPPTGPGGDLGNHSTNGPGHLRPMGPAKPLTPEQVGLVRAWIDQGAK